MPAPWLGCPDDRIPLDGEPGPLYGRQSSRSSLLHVPGRAGGRILAHRHVVGVRTDAGDLDDLPPERGARVQDRLRHPRGGAHSVRPRRPVDDATGVGGIRRCRDRRPPHLDLHRHSGWPRLDHPSQLPPAQGVVHPIEVGFGLAYGSLKAPTLRTACRGPPTPTGGQQPAHVIDGQAFRGSLVSRHRRSLPW